MIGIEYIGVLIPIVALMIPIVAIWTGHQRKMLEMRLMLQQGAQGANSAETERLRQEFQMLRESLTAHAMSVDENMKVLASRVSNVENRLGSVTSNQELTGGRG
jgi:hypothetical protein